jgi:glycosyltransferase involved in cell wall biosynthesis
MKVLIISKEFPPDIGGAGVVAYNNAFQLSEFGHKVVVLTSKLLKNQRVESFPFRVVEVKNSRLWFVNFYFKIKKMLDFDVFIFNDPHSVYVAGMALNQKNFNKSICYLHGSEPELIYEKQTLIKRIFFFRFFYNKAISKCYKIVSVSNFMKQKMIHKTLMDRKVAEKIIVNYAGVNFDSISHKEHSRGSAVNNDTIRILSVGRVIKEKGYDSLAKVLSDISDKVSFTWTIVGDGAYMLELMDLCRVSKIYDRVVFVGRVDRGELHKYYSSADLFIVLSRLQESFSLAHLEAQAYGVPSIGLNHSGMKECIVNEETGFLLDNERQLVDLLLSRRFEVIEQAKCIANARSFTLEKTVKKLETILLELSE